MTDHSTVSNYKDVLTRIASAAQDAERAPGDVSLTVVSKTWDPEQIRPVLEAGHRVFGENRIQEAQGKWPDLKAAYPGVWLHLIGPLQTNKDRDAVRLFDVIETLDREKLAQTLEKLAEKGELIPELFVQVNTGEETQKAGIAPKQAADFTRYCRDDLALPVTGLMAIPPVEEPPAPHFALLHKLGEELGLPRLSMGMSGDYEIAAQLGATDVRVGSAIFGPRHSK